MLIPTTTTHSDGLRLAGVTHSSDQPPLLLLHGVTRRWQTFLPIWSSLADRWQLHAVDFRGHGQSGNANGKYRVCNYVRDAVAYIETHFDRPTVVYGHSLGAMVAAAVAAECGERVAGIVLEDPPLHTMGAQMDQTPLLSFFEALKQLAGDQRSLKAIASDLAEARLIDPGSLNEVRLGDLRDPVSLRFTARCLQQLDPEVLTPILSMDWLRDFDVESVFRNVECPTLVLQADTRSGGMLTDLDASMIEVSVADAVRVRFDGCGHLIHWTQTTALLNHVHGFLETLPR